MNHFKVFLSAAATILIAGTMSSASATGCTGAGPCDIAISNNTTNLTTNTTTNAITTTFSEQSAAAGLRLQSVYDATGTFSQSNAGAIKSEANHDYLITTGRGDVSIDVTAIGNNFSANLVGMGDVNLSLSQRNTGNITATDTVRHPYVGGNMEISTTAIGNNASVNWDLTTDKSPSSNNFDVKKDGPVRSFDTVGSFLGSISQCNTGAILAQTGYSQDPSANIKVSTTAIGNNISFGVKTR